MNLDTQASGMVFTCDGNGIVQDILRDDLKVLTSDLIGKSIISLLDPSALAKGRVFWQNLKAHAAAFDWELTFKLDGQVRVLYVAAGKVWDQVLVVATPSRGGITTAFYEELMQINNEQVNLLRSTLKDQSKLLQANKECESRDEKFYTELTRLNNELVTMHRKLAKENAERKRLQDQLQEYTENLEQMVQDKVRELELERAKVIHAGKMASLGEMATGVAHELKQPLTAMLFEADYLKALAQKQRAQGDAVSMPDQLWDELYQVGENLIQDIARSRRIIDHLRTFGRISDNQMKLINLNRPIEDCFILTRERLYQHNVHVEQQLSPDLPLILADPYKLEQVFLNLVSNAEYALQTMVQRIVDGELVRPDFKKTLQVMTYVEDDTVVAVVRDNGSGMPEDVQAQLFTPFFTTKPIGEGTGLGLSISHSIVTEAGGEISCESEINVGTTFMLRFPVSADEELL